MSPSCNKFFCIFGVCNTREAYFVITPSGQSLVCKYAISPFGSVFSYMPDKISASSFNCIFSIVIILLILFSVANILLYSYTPNYFLHFFRSNSITMIHRALKIFLDDSHIILKTKSFIAAFHLTLCKNKALRLSFLRPTKSGNQKNESLSALKST